MQRPDLDAPASEWLVYGDALQVAGDPRGELIGLAHAVAEGRVTEEARDAAVTKHWAGLFGKAPSHTDAYRFDWHHTGLRGVTITVRPGEEDPVGPFLDAPAATDVRSIRLVGDGAGLQVDLVPAMGELLERAPASCTHFGFIDAQAERSYMLVSRDFDPGDNLVKLGPIEPFLARAKSLELSVADSHQLELGSFAAQRLEAFTLRCLRFSEFEAMPTMAARMNAAKFEQLQAFELRCVEEYLANTPVEFKPYINVYSADDYEGDPFDDGESEGVDWAALSGLWSTLATCPLNRLALTSVTSGPSLVEALVAAGPFAQVKELDLSDGSLGVFTARLLDTAKTTFPSLATLRLERTDVTDDDAGLIRSRLGIEVIHSYREGAPTYRYIVGQE